MSMHSKPLYGMDLSHWNWPIDLQQVVAEGYRFGLFKATQGDDFIDPRFDEYIDAAHAVRERAPGFIPGAYHFVDGSEPSRQAANFMNTLRGSGGPDGWLLALDVEGYGATYTGVMDICRDLAAQLPGAFGRLLIYTNNHYWVTKLGNPPPPLGTRLWYAQIGRAHV